MSCRHCLQHWSDHHERERSLKPSTAATNHIKNDKKCKNSRETYIYGEGGGILGRWIGRERKNGGREGKREAGREAGRQGGKERWRDGGKEGKGAFP